MSITIDSLDVTDLSTNGLLFEFRRGTPSDLAEYDGMDDTVPEASGMYAGVWTPRRRLVSLYGEVIGSGNDLETMQASFRARMDALVAVMDVSSLVTIETEDEFGVAAATLENVRPQRLVVESEFASIVWIGFLELLCIDSPPHWVIGS